MIGSMSLQEVQGVTGGKLVGGDVNFCDVSIDTRSLKNNDLFIAIKGPNFNGNEYIGSAAEKQAAGVIASEAVDQHFNFPVLTVEDSRLALGKIGELNRIRSNACVLALTGSQGKTSVKEMSARILAQCGEVIMTKGNLNNELGVPLSLLKIEEQHEFAVIELGANGPGEIAYSASLTQPRIGHITNIAGTHLEGFKSLEGVASAKAEIWQCISEDGTAVVNLDDQFAEKFIAEIMALGRHLVTLSCLGKNDADYFADNIQLEGFRGSSFRLNTPNEKVNINLQVAGKHNVSNAIAAAAMTMTAGASVTDVKAGLEEFSSVRGRLCITSGVKNSTLIDDSYNASPSSFCAAIDVLALSKGTRVVVMGDMAELGTEAEAEHYKIGEYARQCSIEHFIAVGNLSAQAVAGFGEGGIFLDEREKFLETILPFLDDTTTVLIKGSRSQLMEKLVERIKADEKCI